MDNGRVKGTVSRWNSTRGFGFVKRDGSYGKDCFAHYTAIRGEGYRDLVEGERVEFTVTMGPKGPMATDIARLGPEPVNDADWAPRAFGDFDDDGNE